MNCTPGTSVARYGLVLLAAGALAVPAFGEAQQQPAQQPQQQPAAQQQQLTPEQQRALQLRQQQMQQQLQQQQLQQQRLQQQQQQVRQQQQQQQPPQQLGQPGAARAGQQQGQSQQTIVELKPNQRAVAAIVFPDGAQGQAETISVALAEGDPQTGATNREQSFNARNAPTGIVTHALGQQRRAGNQARAVFIAARRGVNLVPLQEAGGDGDAMRVFVVRRQDAGQPNQPGVAGAAPAGLPAQPQAGAQPPQPAPGAQPQPGDPQVAAAQQAPLGQQQQQQPAPGQQPPLGQQQQPPAAGGAAGMPMGQAGLGEEKNDVVVFVYLISDAAPQRNRR